MKPKPRHETFISRERSLATELQRTSNELARAKKELETLYAALDNVESGILVLNKDLRAQYSNPSLHKLFKVSNPEEIRATNPLYSDMLKDAAAAAAVDLEQYVKRRLSWVQSGNTAPMDLSMTNGAVIRCHIAVLPGGGRMLIYSDVTDIVRNAQELERLATTDGMTGIFNRRHFLALADREWRRARRYRRALSFLMIDIDYFKSINYSYGHQVGDTMITHLANVTRECKRDTDVLARIGGEEFALLLPETDAYQAEIVAERIRHEVSINPLALAARSVPATVSVGVASATANMSDFSQLMSAADQALYEAKRCGRNRVFNIKTECYKHSFNPESALLRNNAK
jgi:diguanylate cyclase (GGDEF)-like protein